VLRALARGPAFTTFRALSPDEVWWATGSGGGALVHLLAEPRGAVVRLRAWGPGSQWAAEQLPRTLGLHDDPSGFDPSPLLARAHPAVRDAWRRHAADLVAPATGAVTETPVHAILEQRVTGIEARRAWGWLLAAYGEPAPGPAPERMFVFPEPAAVASVPSWEWHRAAVDGSRSATIVRAVGYAGRLQECADLPLDAARARMTAIPGIGWWTWAEVASRALGDADAVSFGDFHVAKNVVYALTGEQDGTDERLEELLEPWRGHRGRVQRLVEMTGISRPARGPRYSPLDHRSR